MNKPVLDLQHGFPGEGVGGSVTGLPELPLVPQKIVAAVDPHAPLPAPARHTNGWACVARFGGIGDNLQCASPLKLLKQKWGKLEVMSQAPQDVVFKNNPYVDKLSVIDRAAVPQDTSGNWQGYFVGRAQEYDAFYHLSHSVETVGALFVGQTHFHWPASFRRKFCGQSYLERIHDICEVPYEFGPLFFPTDAEHAQARETKKKVGPRMIAWVLSGTRLDKVHPYAAVAVAQMIREVGPVVALGAPGKNFEAAKAMQEDVRRFNGTDKHFHVCISFETDKPNWDIRRLMTFAQHADIVVGPDTGPMWAVAFEDQPKVMLLSHASAENITKHWRNTVTLHADQAVVPCWPCHQLHDTTKFCTPNQEKNGAACISNIGVQTIVQTVAQHW